MRMSINTDAIIKLLGKNIPPPIAELLSQLPPAELFRELMRFASMTEAEKLSSLSEETLRREHGDKVEQLSPRRYGMRLYNALMLRG
jgi:hypothetical protein